MIRSIRADSFRRAFNLPNDAIQGYSSSPSIINFSATASETNSRKGIPRWAATVFARLKSASGSSRVVFILLIVPYLWVSAEKIGVRPAERFGFRVPCGRQCKAKRHGWL